MRRYAWILFVVVLIVAGIFLSGKPAAAQTSSIPTPVPGRRTQPDGSISNSISPSSLTGKTLSNPYCYQPDPGLNQCVINLRYYSASDNGTMAPYLNYALISIGTSFSNLVVRTRINLFFENSLSYSYDMIPGGLKVPCGTPNQGGQGNSFGAAYYVKVEPFDTTNTSMGWDQAYLSCPAYAP